ncbi:MAG: hypothetical protein A2X49_12945 [Lentisphaerae bacterium GWF2_52_8]|nr:MAG: hypothetical protein A2X49_12945 [Lentisphaerae bacterium GWF2_52_8]
MKNAGAKGHVTIVSCGIGEDCISPAVRKAVESAELLYGSSRLLPLFPGFKGERKVLAAETQEYVNAIVKTEVDRNVSIAVLTTGDALFFGLARRFAELLPHERLTIIPNVSSAQAFFAKLKQPWESAHFFIAQGRDAIIPWREILNEKCAVICCNAIHPPCRIAAELLEKWPHAASRLAAFGENIGLENERIEIGSLESISVMESAGNSLLALLPHGTEEGVSPGLPLGLPDSFFLHEKEDEISGSELRALAISKLRIGPGVIWDIGSGGASLGLEACALCPELQLYVIEERKDYAARIRHNAERLSINENRIVISESEEEIRILPKPRAVFVGNSVREVAKIIEESYKKLLPGGVIVACAESMENRVALDETLKFACAEVISISASKVVRHSGGADRRMMRQEKPFELYVYGKSFE